MRLWTLQKNKRGQRSPNKKRGQRSAQKNKKREKREKNERKERRDNVTILLSHLCLRVAPCSSYRESLELSLSYTSGNFHYRTWLVYSDDGLPQNARGLHEQASWMHTHLVTFVELYPWLALT